jgi:predicted MPP superfamily phosphohydrolase
MIKSLFLALLAAALIAGGAFAVKAFWIEPRSLVITRADIAVPQWPADARLLKIAMLADIQAAGPHVTAERVAEVVAQVNALEPDLIVLLGDYVSQMRLSTSHVPPKATAAVLARLRAPLGVHAVLGNHDWWLDGHYVRGLLENAGIKVYENAAQPVDAGGGRRFWIAGLADLSSGAVDLPGTLGQITDDAPVILLSHSPDVFPEVPERVALTLAGHTHGGQVNLPFVGPSDGAFPLRPALRLRPHRRGRSPDVRLERDRQCDPAGPLRRPAGDRPAADRGARIARP